MRRALVVAVGLVGQGVVIGACGKDAAATRELPPIDFDAASPRVIDCERLAQVYLTRCGLHLGIDDDTGACALVRDGQGGGPLAATIGRAAAVCADNADDCDRIFVCVADDQGLSALTQGGRVTGTAEVEGEVFTFDAGQAWVWIGTKPSALPGDLGVLFTHRGEPWYFRLEDFAERASLAPFEVDAARPVKLENGEDNVEIASGTVSVVAYSMQGRLEVHAQATDPLTGDALDLVIEATFD